MNKSNPKISVVMPVYNGECYIADSVRSVLNQTFTDFELIIINDASTDKTIEVLQQFSDPRIVIRTNAKNIGSANSRTSAIHASNADYIAILDADDIAYKDRFEKQINFLEKNKEFGMVATWVKIIDGNGKPTGVALKDRVKPDEVPVILLFHNIFACSSTMLRKSALPENPFRQEMMPVEDIDLWFRMIDNGWKMDTLKQILIEYRSHEKGISKVFNERRQNLMNGLIRSRIEKLGVKPTDDELSVHRTNFGYSGQDIEIFLKKRVDWLMKLKTQNQITGVYPKTTFDNVLGKKILESCSANTKIGLRAWHVFWRSPLAGDLDKKSNIREISKFFFKAVLKR